MWLRVCDLAPLDVITLNSSSSMGVDIMLNNQIKLTFLVTGLFLNSTLYEITINQCDGIISLKIIIFLLAF